MMYLCSQLVFVILVHGISSVDGSSDDVTSTTEVTTKYFRSTISVAPNTSLNKATLTSLPPLALKDETTALHSAINTTGDILTNETTFEDRAPVSNDASASPESGPTSVIIPSTTHQTESASTKSSSNTHLNSTLISLDSGDSLNNDSSAESQTTDSMKPASASNPAGKTDDDVTSVAVTPAVSSEDVTKTTSSERDLNGSGSSETVSSSQTRVSEPTTGSSNVPGKNKPGTNDDTSAESKDRTGSAETSSTQLSVLGVVFGTVGALAILLFFVAVYRKVKDPEKKKMLVNKEAKRIDMRILRRFAVNDVKSSLRGIPANGDIWLEMDKDTSVVV